MKVYSLAYMIIMLVAPAGCKDSTKSETKDSYVGYEDSSRRTNRVGYFFYNSKDKTILCFKYCPFGFVEARKYGNRMKSACRFAGSISYVNLRRLVGVSVTNAFEAEAIYEAQPRVTNLNRVISKAMPQVLSKSNPTDAACNFPGSTTPAPQGNPSSQQVHRAHQGRPQEQARRAWVGARFRDNEGRTLWLEYKSCTTKQKDGRIRKCEWTLENQSRFYITFPDQKVWYYLIKNSDSICFAGEGAVQPSCVGSTMSRYDSSRGNPAHGREITSISQKQEKPQLPARPTRTIALNQRYLRARNNTSKAISLRVHYKYTVDSRWNVGRWRIDPGESFYLADENGRDIVAAKVNYSAAHISIGNDWGPREYTFANDSRYTSFLFDF